MARPFQYDTYVKSEIGINGDYEHGNVSHARSTVQRHDGPFYQSNFGGVDEATGKNKLKNQINELIGLCKDENQGINGEFSQVVGAEREIYDLLQEEMYRQPSHNPPSNKYVRSNVQNFPLASKVYQPAEHGYHQQAVNNFGYLEQIKNQQPYNEHPFPQGQYQQGFDNNAFQPTDKNTFLKSKVQELIDENRQLKYQTSQVVKSEDDSQIKHLQQEIIRLRSLLPQYEAEIQKLRRRKGGSNKLNELKEQGEKIRQDTIYLLKSKSSTSFANSPNYSNREFAQQLAELQKACEQLQAENTHLKRMSKGTENTRIPHRYY